LIASRRKEERKNVNPKDYQPKKQKKYKKYKRYMSTKIFEEFPVPLYNC